MLRKSLTLFTLCAVLLLAATGMVWADQEVTLLPGADPDRRPSPSPRPVVVTVMGVVQSVAADGFAMLSGDDQEINILVNEDTEFVIPGDDTPDLSDLLVGDPVVVAGWRSTEVENTITAKMVAVRRVLPQPVRVAGQVTEVDVTNSSFQLAVGDPADPQDVKVLVTTETEFVMPGVEEPGLDKLLVGDKAVVASEPIAPAAAADLTEITARIVYVERTPARPVKFLGRVAEMDFEAGTFDVVLGDGSVKHIATNEDTGYGVPGVEEPTLADVKDGDIVRVVAKPMETATTAEESFIALSVVVQKPRPVTLMGVIGQVDETAGMFELELAGGEVKEIKTNDDTRYKVPGVEEPTLADLETGQRAVVTALAVPIPALTTAVVDEQLYELVARLVVVQRPRPANVAGTIASVDTANGLFVLETNNGETRQILVGEETTLVIPGVEDPGLEDLANQIGAKAVVKGTLAPDGSILAQAVVVKPMAPRRGSVVGEVIAIAEVTDGMDLTVQTAQGERHVLVTEETNIRPEGAEIVEGSRIVAAGLWMADGSLNALMIYVRPALPTPPVGPTA